MSAIDAATGRVGLNSREFGVGWEVTPLARARVVGHEATLAAIEVRLSRELTDRGHQAARYSLVAHVSPEAGADDVVLHLSVAGLHDSASRLCLWEALSDALSEFDDSFVVERLSLVVEPDR